MNEKDRDISGVPTSVNPDVDVDDLFEVLSNSRRRVVVECLEASSAPMTVADLAAAVASRERDAAISSVPEDSVTAVHVELHHVHLPRMADAGVLEYDRGRDSVALAASGAELASCLSSAGADQ